MPSLTVNGQRLRELRASDPRRQIELALAADISPARLRKLEQGGQNAQLKTVARLAVVYDVDPEDLLVWNPS
jgi:transcriptional regulator with XRE-family HTH domain